MKDLFNYKLNLERTPYIIENIVLLLIMFASVVFIPFIAFAETDLGSAAFFFVFIGIWAILFLLRVISGIQRMNDICKNDLIRLIWLFVNVVDISLLSLFLFSDMEIKWYPLILILIFLLAIFPSKQPKLKL